MAAEITEYIRQHEATVAPLYKDYSLKFWELSLSAMPTTRKRSWLRRRSTSRSTTIASTSKASLRSIRRPMDTIDARELKLIHDSFVPNQIEESVLRDIVERETRSKTSSTRSRGF